MEATTLSQETPQSLMQSLPTDGVLSVVLDVNPGNPINAGASLHTRAKHLMADLGAPEALLQSVMADLGSAQRTTRTRVYFVWDEHHHVKSQVVDSQLEIPESAQFGAPNLEPIRFSIQSSPRTLIALADRRWGRIFIVHLGAISELRRTEGSPLGLVAENLGHPAIERQTDDDHEAGRVTHQDLKFNKAFVAALLELQQTHAFEQLLIAGPVDSRSSLKLELPTALSELLLGEVAVAGDASPANLLETAKDTLESAEASAEDRLLEQVRTHNGVRGAEETLRAVQEGRLYQLLVAGDGSSLRVWRDSDGYVFGVYPEQGASPLTGRAVEGKSLRDVLPELRQKFGLRVQFLRGSKAELLMSEMGGLAGMPRY